MVAQTIDIDSHIFEQVSTNRLPEFIVDLKVQYKVPNAPKATGGDSCETRDMRVFCSG